MQRKPGASTPAARPPVPEEAVAAVFARAAELDAELSPEEPHALLDVEALVEVGMAVGLSPAAVRRAVAEHQAGAVLPAASTPSTWVGPRVAVAERRLRGDARGVRRSVERSLERQWFRKVRGADGHSLWTARDDLAARVSRQVDFKKRLVLKGVTGVALTAVDCDDDEVAVRLEADLGDRRNDLGWMVAGTTTVGTLAGGVLALAFGPDPAVLSTLVLLPAAAAGGGGGVAIARRAYQGQLQRLTDDLEGMLDRAGGHR